MGSRAASFFKNLCKRFGYRQIYFEFESVLACMRGNSDKSRSERAADLEQKFVVSNGHSELQSLKDEGITEMEPALRAMDWIIHA
jgi:hypothetical protein